MGHYPSHTIAVVGMACQVPGAPDLSAFWSNTLAGRVSIRLAEEPEGIRVDVRDDGVGLPDGFSAARSADLGLQIVRTLVEQDLKGRLSLSSSGHGVRAVIHLPRPEGA